MSKTVETRWKVCFLFCQSRKRVNRKVVIPQFSVVMCHGWNDNLQFCLSSQKICEELSANQMVKTAQSELFQLRLKMSRKRSVRQRFSSNYTVAFSFFTITPNDRGYGHLAVCGSIRCRETTKWMREQNRRNALQPANAHRRVLGVCGFFSRSNFSRSVVNSCFQLSFHFAC